MGITQKLIPKTQLTLAFLVAALVLLTVNIASAQKPPYYRWIKLVDGQKKVFRGRVYEDHGYNYQFNARAGQIITVKLIAKDTTFAIHAYDLDPNDQLTPDDTSCSYTLIRNHTGQYAIALKMTSESLIYPHFSTYRLEVTLK